MTIALRILRLREPVQVGGARLALNAGGLRFQRSSRVASQSPSLVPAKRRRKSYARAFKARVIR
jgi:hypothetical protein